MKRCVHHLRADACGACFLLERRVAPDLDTLAPIVGELRRQGMTWTAIALQLCISMSTVAKARVRFALSKKASS